MTMIDTADSRFPKAVAIADTAGQWLKCRTAEGRKAYGIRSSHDANHVYFVTQTSCDCYDAQRHVCKHQVAVQIHCARLVGKPMPASDTVDELAQMAIDRHPVTRHDPRAGRLDSMGAPQPSTAIAPRRHAPPRRAVRRDLQALRRRPAAAHVQSYTNSAV